MKAQELLFQLQDKGYRDFQSKLIPTIPVETIIGVRIPAIRKLAKEYGKDPESRTLIMMKIFCMRCWWRRLKITKSV